MKTHWITCPLVAAEAALLSGAATANDGTAGEWWSALSVDPGIEIAWQSEAPRMVLEIARPMEAPWLLASSVIDSAPPTRDLDPWWSTAVSGPHREPTDPDSPSLPAGSSLESPWEAWENQAVDSRGEWEFLGPDDR
jgi:hypothetical protein